mgnify:CR=1 FL=1
MDFRGAQVKNMMRVASMSDYIRCDMAYLVLNDQIQSNWGNQISSWGYQRPSTEFWADAIAEVKKSYNVQFLAEVYDPWTEPLQNVGFDFTYNKGLYDRLGNGNLDDIRGYISGTPPSYFFKSAHCMYSPNVRFDLIS